MKAECQGRTRRRQMTRNVGMDGGVPRPEAADQNLEGRVPGPGPDDLDVDVMEGRVPGPHRPEQEPDNHVEAEEPEVPAMPADPPGERVVVPRGPQQGERRPKRDWRGGLEICSMPTLSQSRWRDEV